LSALKCAHCGLVNFATATQCKRCRTPFVQELSSADGSQVQGIVLEDGYVLPPPPSLGTEGVWRDKATLVMSRDARLPDRKLLVCAPVIDHSLNANGSGSACFAFFANPLRTVRCDIQSKTAKIAKPQVAKVRKENAFGFQTEPLPTQTNPGSPRGW
jgi:hypothetical protein